MISSRNQIPKNKQDTRTIYQRSNHLDSGFYISCGVEYFDFIRILLAIEKTDI
jgi:hypothetical protein